MFRWRSALVAVCVAAVAAGGATVVAAQQRPVPASEALAAYVAKPDDTFTWRVQRRYQHPDAEVLELHLESQTWQGTLWKHQLLLIRPKRVSDPGHAALIIGGGRWRDGYEAASDDITLPEDGELFVVMARALRSTVVVMGQVPFQPLFDLTEDRLIAHTFDRYLKTGDTEWPLLLPMVKSAVRAIDASSAAASREWGAPLEYFGADLSQLPPQSSHAADTRQEALHALCREAGVSTTAARLVAGAPHLVLEKLQQGGEADLVVMGALARGRFAELVLGSTAERVLHHGRGDVLVVKPTPASR